jgi:hypothetical protein
VIQKEIPSPEKKAPKAKNSSNRFAILEVDD